MLLKRLVLTCGSLQYSPVASCNAQLLDGLFRSSTLSQSQTRSVRTKAMVLNPEPKPEPWPYKEKGFSYWHQLDFTKKRMDENSKFFVVDGNIASGKTELCKAIAEAFGFYYLPDPTLDAIVIDSYGHDMRTLYDKIPEPCRLPDVKMFHEDPSIANGAKYQYNMMLLRCEATLNALAHILNTGQGVVVERCWWSDCAFVDAMFKKGLISKNFKNFYFKSVEQVEPFVKHCPHVYIYLDTPAEVCLERIKKRGIPYENNGLVIDLEYLKLIEESFKHRVLPKMKRTGEILVFDASEAVDVDVVCDSIEKLDLQTYDWHIDEKFEGWAMVYREEDLIEYRVQYTGKQPIMKYFNLPMYEVPELMIHPLDLEDWRMVLEKVEHGRGQHFSLGFNVNLGDSLWTILSRGGINRKASLFNIRPWQPHLMQDNWSLSLKNAFWNF